MHKEQPVDEEMDADKNPIKREIVDIYKMCDEIDGCLDRVTDSVKKDLARIALLDTKLHN